MIPVVDKWIDIFEEDLGVKVPNRSIIYNSYNNGHALELKDKGFALCIVYDDFLGNKICSDIMVYLKPEERNYKNFKILIDFIEKIANNNNCKFITLGCSIGYDDDRILKMYSRLGYGTSSVRKEI